MASYCWFYYCFNYWWRKGCLSGQIPLCVTVTTAFVARSVKWKDEHSTTLQYLMGCWRYLETMLYTWWSHWNLWVWGLSSWEDSAKFIKNFSRKFQVFDKVAEFMEFKEVCSSLVSEDLRKPNSVSIFKEAGGTQQILEKLAWLVYISVRRTNNKTANL